MNVATPRVVGRALVVASASGRVPTVAALEQLGFTCGEADDPYAAMLELCRRPNVYKAVVLGLASLHREELAIVQSVKARLPHVEVWLTQTDGKPAAMAEALRLGADGLLGEDGLHRLGPTPPPAKPPADLPHGELSPVAEPILTADELRALLQEPATGRDRTV